MLPSIETLPGFEARAAFTVNSATVFREDVDIVPTRGIFIQQATTERAGAMRAQQVIDLEASLAEEYFLPN